MPCTSAAYSVTVAWLPRHIRFMCCGPGVTAAAPTTPSILLPSVYIDMMCVVAISSFLRHATSAVSMWVCMLCHYGGTTNAGICSYVSRLAPPCS